MIWLLSRPVVWPAKAGFTTGRVIGYRRLTVFFIGVVVGMLVAPMAGYELRKLIKAADPVSRETCAAPDEIQM